MKKIILITTMFLVFSGMLRANQQRIISGFISDDSGQALSGVSVIAENSNRGTTSDENGFYTLEVLPSDKRIIFSFVGMETQKVKIGIRNIINITLRAENLKMEEVVAFDRGNKMQKSVGIYSTAVGGNFHISRASHPAPEWNTENYATIHENGFRNALANPLSTFSIDVDNASYSNVRRYINQGSLPPVDAIRVEEMINYFNYDYQEPSGEHPFSVNTELATCPWNTKHYLLHVGLKGKSFDKSELPASNLVFLIDVSGSMEARVKLPLLKRAFKMLVNELRPNDKVAIVVYAGAAGVVLEPTPGNNKTKILEALNNLSAGGSTAGGEGLKLAYETAKENFMKNGNNRIILATDGDFNVGVSSTSEMERLVEKERDNGIFMTVLGFGMGNIKDDKMETIADKGNGNYAYIDNIQEARKVFITEFGGTLFTIAKDVKFQLEFNPQKVKAYRLVGYENRLLNAEDFNDDKKDAGEMGAGHTVTALYEIIPANSDETSPSVDPLKYQNSNPISGKNSKELLTIKLRYKPADGNTSKLVEFPVDGKLAKQTTNNFRFSAAVASFGMLLRNSEFLGSTTVDSILLLAKNAKGDDNEGYRSEFIQLVKTVEDQQLLVND